MVQTRTMGRAQALFYGLSDHAQSMASYRMMQGLYNAANACADKNMRKKGQTRHVFRKKKSLPGYCFDFI
ncbi:hypothetical protein DPF_0698 [Desulfoplanes formicivorans]|uniref:Uncharacterized protein n=1 Tax=Desulfoplanes formicivorans TaxID=1592317 RepID=A0A194AGU9_9BACT|nr:hypothetical protein DPF_0698 [Desulfoplanes formicivorans]